MEVILTKDVKGLGYKYDVVKVRNGYGRNYLIPRGLAILATEGAKKHNQEMIKQRAFKEEKLRKEAQAFAEKLQTTVVKIGVKAGESGKIFGSVTNVQLAEALNSLGLKVERKAIEVPDNVKTLGSYKAKVQIYKDIKTEFTFELFAE
ncbi:MAG: 50S ribosomal protein L9 [Bacteroidia bacterium]|nr:50S ribosomal protein L9 [Bacteroidia bacterium]